jgi:choline monooxygenase
VPGQCHPALFLDGVLDVPLLFTRDAGDRLHALSNVCTHRGMLVCEGDTVQSTLRCRYHGRKFDLNGGFRGMPEFEGAVDFPSPADDLPRVPFAAWGRMLFASLAPAVEFDTVVRELRSRLDWLPFDRAVLDVSRSRDYQVRANWALYVENYLEGFHIPFVHPALAGALDFARYRTELHPWSNVQIGFATGAESALAPPAGHLDHGERIAGYYCWFFPSTMLNVYPWGISVNAVQPLAADRSRIRYLTYVWDESLLDRGAGAGLDRVEREDESVVEAVQRGVRSKLYDRGRYSPSRETGVHHFHRLLVASMHAAGARRG